MPIEKLEEFARDGQKNTDELVLTDGFPRPKFPARQWFNYLFNTLSLKINELIELDPIARSEIVDNLTTNDAKKIASARTVKELNDSKLSKLDFDDAYKYMPIPYPKLIPPSGFLVMMGQDIVESIYPKLFALYGQKLPDMRAYSIRGLDNGRGVDTDRTILSEQLDEIKSHNHKLPLKLPVYSPGKGLSSGGFNVSDVPSEYEYTNQFGGSETRVKNIAFLYIVKAG